MGYFTNDSLQNHPASLFELRRAREHTAAFSSHTRETHTPGSRLQGLGRRSYNPTLGRWINRDPLDDVSKTQTGLYRFVDNNAISSVDSIGLVKLGDCRVTPGSLTYTYKYKKGTQGHVISGGTLGGYQCAIRKIKEKHWTEECCLRIVPHYWWIFSWDCCEEWGNSVNKSKLLKDEFVKGDGLSWQLAVDDPDVVCKDFYTKNLPSDDPAPF